MTSHAVADDHIFTILNWCTEAYLRYGRKLNLPQNTDPTKTYQWRYAAAIAKKFVEWNFDDETSKRFIDVAIRHANHIGIMQKGLAALHQGNMLDVCYKIFLDESTTNTQILDSLLFMRNWLKQKAGPRDLKTILTTCSEPGGFHNITLWYQASRISALYLSLSKVCNQALAVLNRDFSDERGLLPKQTQLYLTRAGFLNDNGNLVRAREIFINDWREPCL